jgi:hypothetical protein
MPSIPNVVLQWPKFSAVQANLEKFTAILSPKLPT